MSLTEHEDRMRPPDVLAALILAHKNNPTLRMGQLIERAMKQHGAPEPLRFISDQDLALALQNYADKT
jgi:hypothetical protein